MKPKFFGAVALKPTGNSVLVEDGEGGLDWVDPGKITPVKTSGKEPAVV